MKKTTFLSTITFAFILLLTTSVNAQNFVKVDKSPMDVSTFPPNYKISEKQLKIVYSRPQLKGRSVSSLTPKGKVWRVGANEAAELTLYTDMKLGSTNIKAGTYTFYIIPRAKEWTAIISTDLNVWGSYFYKEANDVARLSVPVTTTAEESLEHFSIAFTKSDTGADMHLGWGTTRAVVPFTN